jgi:hypothetical protein
MAMRVEGNKEGDGKEKGEVGKGNGDGDKCGRQATVTTWATATAMRWWATKRAIMRAARAITMAGNNKGNGKGGKGNGNGNYNGGRQRGQLHWQ